MFSTLFSMNVFTSNLSSLCMHEGQISHFLTKNLEHLHSSIMHQHGIGFTSFELFFLNSTNSSFSIAYSISDVLLHVCYYNYIDY